jgi:hypothetical protein
MPARRAVGGTGRVSRRSPRLAEEADGLDGAEITAQFEHRTAFDASADWDSSVARLTVTRSRLDEAFGLFAAVLRGDIGGGRRVAGKRLADIAQQLMSRAVSPTSGSPGSSTPARAAMRAPPRARQRASRGSTRLRCARSMRSTMGRVRRR